jgi:hypothetical protein
MGTGGLLSLGCSLAALSPSIRMGMIRSRLISGSADMDRKALAVGAVLECLYGRGTRGEAEPTAVGPTDAALDAADTGKATSER